MDKLIGTGTTNRRLLRSNSPKRVVSEAASATSAYIIIRWSFLLFVFSIPFEAVNLDSTFGSLSLARPFGLLFLASCFLAPQMCFPHPPRALWWFLGYVTVFILNGLFVPEEFVPVFFSYVFTLTQLLIFFWVASGLLKVEKLARRTLLTFSIASAFLAFGSILNIPGFAVAREADEGRLTALGFNPNELANLLALAAVTLIGLRLDKRNVPHLLNKTLYTVLTLPVLVLLVRTGSRTGVGAFIIGISLYLLQYQRSGRKITSIIWVSLAIAGAIYAVASDPDSLSRWYGAYYEGDTAGRDKIYLAAIDMISEKPILGWQIAFYDELGRRAGRRGPIDAHTLFLYLPLQVGLAGTVPFLVGLWLCVRAAWKARVGNLGLLPLALLTVLLVSNFTHTFLSQKVMWLVLALTLAAASAAARKQRRQPRAVVGSRFSRSNDTRRFQPSPPAILPPRTLPVLKGF